MKLDKGMLGKDINIAKNEGLFVGYNNELVGDILKKYFCVKRREDILLGKVLNQFGYTKDDNILLTNVVYKENEVIIDYSVNGVCNEDNKIIIKFDNLIYNYRLIVSNEDSDISCQVSVFNRRNVKFRVAEINEKTNGGKIYSREYNTYCARYKIVDYDIEVELYLGIEIPNAGYVNPPIFVIEKEKELENYLKNIDVSKGLENIYKDVVNYFSDIFKYLDIKLSIRELNNLVNEHNRFDPIVTDKIHVKNGVCEEFMVTRGNKCIIIDKDGNAVCRYKDEFVDVVTTVNEYDKATYSISAGNEIVLREGIFIHGLQTYEESIDEIDEVKEKILRLVPKKY